MSLLLRMNLILGLMSAIVTIAAGLACHSILDAGYRRDLVREAGLMLDSAGAMRTYTASEIEPLLSKHFDHEFLPQSVPFYAATQNFLKLREKHPEYYYKEATLNPTNLRDRAADWEADLVQRFRHDGGVSELHGTRDTPIGASLYLARPIRVEAECLICHSQPSLAPTSMVARYGSNNGFGWQPDEIVGAQIISVPIAREDAGFRRSFVSLLCVIVGVAAGLWLTANVAVYYLAVAPLQRMDRIAESLSTARPSAEEIATKGAREIRRLGASFNRMRTSLDKAIKLLGH